MKNAVESSHRYVVEVYNNDNTGLVHGITISYSTKVGTPYDAVTVAQKSGANLFED